jgi:hypothetical protein
VRHEVGVIDRYPRLGSGDGDQRGVGELSGEPSGVRHREELARIAPDQQDRPGEPGDRVGGIEEQLRAETRGRRDQVLCDPPVLPYRTEERSFALAVESSRGDGGEPLARAD